MSMSIRKRLQCHVGMRNVGSLTAPRGFTCRYHKARLGRSNRTRVATLARTMISQRPGLCAHTKFWLLVSSFCITCMQCRAVHELANAAAVAQRKSNAGEAPPRAALADLTQQSLLSESLIDPARMALLQTACLSGPSVHLPPSASWAQSCRIKDDLWQTHISS